MPCILRAALHRRQSFPLMLKIARCESGLDPYNTNGSSGSTGVFQFMPGTFATTPYGHRSIFSAKWNSLAAAWLMRYGGLGPWVASRPCWG